MIIGLTGPKLSGKGTASDYLQEHHSAKAFSLSGILTDIVNRLYLPDSRANLIGIVTDLRTRFGEDVLAQVLKKDIEVYREAHPDQLIIIDGIRMPTEVDVFSALPGFQLLYIDAPVELRYSRAKGRGEKEGESTMTFEQFQAEEQAVTESHMGEMKIKSNASVLNSDSFDHLYSQLESCIQTKI